MGSIKLGKASTAQKPSIIKSISKYGIAPAVGIGNLITAGLEKITGKKYARQTLEKASSTTFGKILGVATLGTAITLGVAAAPAAAGRVATSFIPKSGLGKAGAIILGGAAVSSPKIASAVIEAPLTGFKTGTAIGEAVENLPAEVQEKAGKFGTAGLLVAGIGGLVAGAGATQIPKIKEFFAGETEGLLETLPAQAGAGPDQPTAIGPAAAMPTGPQTEPLKKTGGKRRGKAKIKQFQPQGQKIMQSVIVNVRSNSHNTKYIRRAMLN